MIVSTPEESPDGPPAESQKDAHAASPADTTGGVPGTTPEDTSEPTPEAAPASAPAASVPDTAAGSAGSVPDVAAPSVTSAGSASAPEDAPDPADSSTTTTSLPLPQVTPATLVAAMAAASGAGPAGPASTGGRRPLTAVFRALVAVAAVTGLAINIALAPDPLRVFTYFTIQSNVLLAVVFVLAALHAWTGRRPLPPLVTGGTLLFISITGIVYHAVLANSSSAFSMSGANGFATSSPWWDVANHLVHTVTPLAALLDWLLLTRPGGLRPRHAALWLLYPLAYLAFALTRGALLSPDAEARYPYPFLDVDLHGYLGVLGNAAIFGVAFCALALLIVGIDRIRPDPWGAQKDPGNRISSPGTGPLK